MSITMRRPAATRPARDPMRRTSLTAGILYLITFVSIPTLALYRPVTQGHCKVGNGVDLL